MKVKEEDEDDEDPSHPNVVMRSNSNAQLRSMVKSIISSRTDLKIDMFKANLTAHLAKSRESLAGEGETTESIRNGVVRCQISAKLLTSPLH
jgi:hypothetical protein